MIPLNDVRRIAVRDAAPGDLVLYWYGPTPVPALRVRAAADSDAAGLIVLGLKASPAPTTFLFDQVADNPCLRLGKAIAVWTGEVIAIRERGNRPAVGSIILAPSGPGIVAAMTESHFHGTAAWSLLDGSKQLATSDHDHIVAWEIGVQNIDGKFERIVKYPYE